MGRRGTHGGNGGAAGDAEALPQTPPKGPVPLETLTTRGTVVRVGTMVARPWGIPGVEGPPGCVRGFAEMRLIFRGFSCKIIAMTIDYGRLFLGQF